MKQTKKILSLIVLVVMVFLSWPQSAEADTLPTLSPTADGTCLNVLNSSNNGCAVNMFDQVNDDPDLPTTTDYIRNRHYSGGGSATSGHIFFELTDTPSNFDTMSTLQIDIDLRKVNFVDDQLSWFAQVVQSDESTALTNEMALADETTADGLVSVAFTGVVASDKTTWDGARLELRWQLDLQSMSDDSAELRITAVELDGTYTAAATNPTYVQNNYRWYVDSDTENVTDPWSSISGVDLAENTAITTLPASNNPPGTGDELRLRVNITVNTATIAADTKFFKLQFREGTDSDCSTGSWTDVLESDFPQTWNYALSSVTDDTALTEAKLTGTDRLETYSKTPPAEVPVGTSATGEDIEFDFHIIGTQAADATRYLFRVVETNIDATTSTVLDTYTNCAILTTAPGTSILMRHGNFFENAVERGFFWAN